MEVGKQIIITIIYLIQNEWGMVSLLLLLLSSNP